MIRHSIATGLAALLLLTACGEDSENTVDGLGFDQIRQSLEPKPESPTAAQIHSRLTPERLATMPGAVAVATLSERKAAAALIEAGRNGNVVTYFTPDGISMALRDGVLVGTRGLGFDLMTADVSGPLAALAGGKSTDVVRVHRYLDGANDIQVRRLMCSYTRTDTKIAETCRSPDTTISNSYVMSESGRIASSRQWIGSEAGYVQIQQVRH